MPRSGQIIPEYQVPHVQTYINDNSTYTEVSSTISETGMRFINVFTSDKGEDGVVKMMRSASDYIEEYGTPNYESYGQPCYMPYAALSTGNARCWCMRVMPEDATYANMVIVAKVKAVDSSTIVASNGLNLDVAAGQTVANNETVANKDKFYIGDISKTVVGNVETTNLTIKGKSELSTVNYKETGVAYPGKWVGVIIDTGNHQNADSSILGNKYMGKHGNEIIFDENAIKEAVAAGAPEYEIKQLTTGGVTSDVAIVKGTWKETTVDGVTTVTYQPYTYFVQWLDLSLTEAGEPNDASFTKSTEIINGMERVVLSRTIETLINGITKKFVIKFIPALAAEVVSDFDRFEIKYSIEYIDNFRDKDGLGLYMQNVLPEENYVDEDGYTWYPVIGVSAKGRGEYGNSLRVRIVSDTNADADNEFKNYIIEVLDSDGALVRREYFMASMYEASIVDAASLYANDVINDLDNGSSKIIVNVDDSAFKAIYNSYVASVVPYLNASAKEIVPSFDEFDFLFGRIKSTLTTKVPCLSVDASSAPFDGTDGVALANGNDGAFAKDTDPIVRKNAINAAYIEAFSGLNEHGVRTDRFDNAILSKRRTPAEYILDANYDDSVKTALANLAINRYDAQLMLDATINRTTVAQVINWATSDTTGIASIADRIISKECSSFKIKDPFTGKVITVTSTYNAAKLLPNHWANLGNHIPFVGEQRTILVDFVRNSVKPAIDADDMVVKETLYTNHVNFYECIAENKFIKATQITSQKEISDMSEMNNVAVLLDMKRKIEDYVASQVYNFSEASDRLRFTDAAEEMFYDYTNTKVKSYSVSFGMNEFEEVRNILHCYLTVVFRTMAKRGIIEIDINKRV